MTATRKRGRPAGSTAAPPEPLSVSVAAAEERLLEQGLLPGVDYCQHAVQLSISGRVPETEHLRACPVCLRRWRVVEATLSGWEPMSHHESERLLPQMALAFTLPERGPRYRAFYAHLAACPECEKGLAELTFDARLPLPAEP